MTASPSNRLGVLEERNLEGEWWIPGERDSRQRGVLDFTAERFDLTLEGGLIEHP